MFKHVEILNNDLGMQLETALQEPTAEQAQPMLLPAMSAVGWLMMNEDCDNM